MVSKQSSSESCPFTLTNPDKKAYFEGIEEANSLQDRIKSETNIDIVGRVAAALQEITGLETRIALEGDKKYFCGLLRVVDNYIQIHPDFGQYVSSWDG